MCAICEKIQGFLGFFEGGRVCLDSRGACRFGTVGIVTRWHGTGLEEKGAVCSCRAGSSLRHVSCPAG